jgi:Ca2+-binding EF-hand superfamily protein
MGQGASPAQIREIIAKVDEDGSGEIEWPEFLTVMRMMYPEKNQRIPQGILWTC